MLTLLNIKLRKLCNEIVLKAISNGISALKIAVFTKLYMFFGTSLTKRACQILHIRAFIVRVRYDILLS